MMQEKSIRYVLLAINGDNIDSRILSSASGLCRRMGAGLDIIFSSSSEKQSPQLANLIQRLQQDGINYRLTQKSLLSSKEIIKYANTHECISTVMIDSLGNWVAPEGEKNSDPWRKLDCPLVVATPD